MTRASVLLFGLLSAALLLSPLTVRAESAESAESEEPTRASTSRPRVKLDRLSFPASFNGAKEFEGHLRSTLKREARRADWGASSSSKISYRFFIEQLDLREEAGVLHVTCTALGRLPKGKSAKSHIAFGGDPRDRKQVIERVLDIVARGVLTRLAELERARRTP